MGGRWHRGAIVRSVVVVGALALTVALPTPTTVDARPVATAAGSTLTTTAEVGAATLPAGALESFGSACLPIVEHLALGPDGAIWASSETDDSIHRMTPDGELTRFSSPEVNGPRGIAVGADGAMWFAMLGPGSSGIGRVTMDGAITVFRHPEMTSAFDAVAGPDGAVWVNGYGKLFRIDTAGSITVFPVPFATYTTQMVVLDGSIWMSSGTSSVSRIAMDGTITTIEDPAIGSGQKALAIGPDGALWIGSWAAGDSGYVRRLALDGTVTAFGGNFGPITALSAGPDGAVWIAGTKRHQVSRMTLAGSVTTFAGTGIDEPRAIERGSDGALWFITATNVLGRISTSGSVQTFSGECVRGPRGVAMGPDGSVWFTNGARRLANDLRSTRPTIGRLSPEGVLTELVSPLLYDGIGDIVAGPDGNLWFANGLSVGRLSPDGTIVTYPVANQAGWPGTMVVGSDGAIWYPAAWSLGRVTMDGVASFHSIPGVGSMQDVAAGPDGALWVVARQPDAVHRVTVGGQVTTYKDPDLFSPSAIVSGPDGALWVHYAGSALMRIATDGEMSSHGLATDGYDSLGVAEDGWLWVGSTIRPIRRVHTDGRITVLDQLPAGTSSTFLAGGDSTMWYVDSATPTAGTEHRSSVLRHVDPDAMPGAPERVTAEAGRERLTVSWEPAVDGSGPIDSYTATVQPGGQTCTRSAGAPLTCSFDGLQVGVNHTVWVRGSSGASTGSAALSNRVMPWSGSTFQGLTPTRLLDSRTTNGGWSGKLAAGAPRSLQVTGRAGIPTDASAVVLNVTATDASAMSFLAVYPMGAPRPMASSLNFLPGDTRPNLVTVPIGTSGRVMFDNAVGSVNVVADVMGYYDPDATGGLYTSVEPNRVLDSRVAGSHPGWAGPLVAGAPRSVATADVPGAPEDGVVAVVLNLTATQATHDTFITAYPEGGLPSTSNVNVRAGETVANHVVVAVDPDDPDIRFATANGSVHVVVDIVGFFNTEAGDRFHPIQPTRVLDSRTGTGDEGAWGPGEERWVQVAGLDGIPEDASGVTSNLTVTDSSTQSFLAAYPDSEARPIASNVNFLAGQTIANAAYLGFPEWSQYVVVYNHLGTVEVIADITGWFARY
jgi:streptogramin lyase